MLKLLEDEANTPIISVVNIWEIQIKAAAGKIDLNLPLEEIVEGYKANDINVLSITDEHVLRLGNLPNLHRDPFDRILIAQALVEKMTILSKDSQIRQYAVPVVW